MGLLGSVTSSSVGGTPVVTSYLAVLDKTAISAIANTEGVQFVPGSVITSTSPQLKLTLNYAIIDYTNVTPVVTVVDSQIGDIFVSLASAYTITSSTTLNEWPISSSYMVLRNQSYVISIAANTSVSNQNHDCFVASATTYSTISVGSKVSYRYLTTTITTDYSLDWAALGINLPSDQEAKLDSWVNTLNVAPGDEIMLLNIDVSTST